MYQVGRFADQISTYHYIDEISSHDIQIREGIIRIPEHDVFDRFIENITISVMDVLFQFNEIFSDFSAEEGGHFYYMNRNVSVTLASLFTAAVKTCNRHRKLPSTSKITVMLCTAVTAAHGDGRRFERIVTSSTDGQGGDGNGDDVGELQVSAM